MFPSDRLLGMRHVITFLMFLGTTVSYATRVSMSVGIVAMTSNNSYGYPVSFLYHLAYHLDPCLVVMDLLMSSSLDD